MSLYNALNKTSYNNPDELKVVTLDNAIYMEVKNDIAFLIADSLHLYEHQSTRNPNMPVTPYGVTYEFASANSRTIIMVVMTTKWLILAQIRENWDNPERTMSLDQLVKKTGHMKNGCELRIRLVEYVTRKHSRSECGL